MPSRRPTKRAPARKSAPKTKPSSEVQKKPLPARSARPRTAARESTLFERKTIRDFGDKALGELKAKGLQVTELPAAEQAKLRDKLQPVVQKFSKEFGEATSKEMLAELEKIRGKK